jgi:hypothetical protein
MEELEALAGEPWGLLLHYIIIGISALASALQSLHACGCLNSLKSWVFSLLLQHAASVQA